MKLQLFALMTMITAIIASPTLVDEAGLAKRQSTPVTGCNGRKAGDTCDAGAANGISYDGVCQAYAATNASPARRVPMRALRKWSPKKLKW